MSMNRIQAARYIAEQNHHHSNADITVDANAQCMAVPTGIWVQGWIYVPNNDIEELMHSPLGQAS